MRCTRDIRSIMAKTSPSAECEPNSAGKCAGKLLSALGGEPGSLLRAGKCTPGAGKCAGKLASALGGAPGSPVCAGKCAGKLGSALGSALGSPLCAGKCSAGTYRYGALVDADPPLP